MPIPSRSVLIADTWSDDDDPVAPVTAAAPESADRIAWRHLSDQLFERVRAYGQYVDLRLDTVATLQALLDFDDGLRREYPGARASWRWKMLVRERTRLRRQVRLGRFPSWNREYVYVVDLHPTNSDSNGPLPPSVGRHFVLSRTAAHVRVSGAGENLDRAGHAADTGPCRLADEPPITLDREALERDGHVQHAPHSRRAYWRTSGDYYTQGGFEALLPAIWAAYARYDGKAAEAELSERESRRVRRAHERGDCAGTTSACYMCQVDVYLGRGSTRGAHTQWWSCEPGCLLCFEQRHGVHPGDEDPGDG